MATLPPGDLRLGRVIINPEVERLSSNGVVIPFDPPLLEEVSFDLLVEIGNAAVLLPDQADLLPRLVCITIYDDGASDITYLSNYTSSLLAPVGTKEIRILSRLEYFNELNPAPGFLNAAKVFTPHIDGSGPFRVPNSLNAGQAIFAGPYSTSDRVTLTLSDDNEVLPGFGVKIFNIVVDRGLIGIASLSDFYYHTGIFGSTTYNSGDDTVEFTFTVAWPPGVNYGGTIHGMTIPVASLFEIALLDIGGNPISLGQSEMELNNFPVPIGAGAVPVFSLAPTSTLALTSGTYRAPTGGDFSWMLTNQGEGSISFKPGHAYSRLTVSKRVPMQYIADAFYRYYPSISSGGSHTVCDVFKLSIRRTDTPVTTGAGIKYGEFFSDYKVAVPIEFIAN